MRVDFDKWWLLPVGIFVASASIALSIIIAGPLFAGLLSAEPAPQAANKPPETETSIATTDCSDAQASSDACYQGHHDEAEPPQRSEGASPVETVDPECSRASSSDFLCVKKRYQDIVRDLGVEAAFAELRSEMARNEFVSSNCHQMTHLIGHAATGIYGNIADTFSHGDSFCGSGYYHGAMEAIVANADPDMILEEADTFCADLGGQQKYSLFHYNCAHGLGHGFMGVRGNELTKSLEACDALSDEWERNRCYGGVFMENVMTKNNPGRPSKYLKADQPLYPCNVVGNRYKNECYQRQSSYALETQGYDFARVFGLCQGVEADFRPACYQGLGWDASVQSIKQSAGDAAISEFTRALCLLGEDYEAQVNCVIGAVEYFIRDRYNDALARAFCEILSAPVRAGCLQETEAYYKSLQSPSERRGT